jgi:hypothetical protein
MTTLASLLHQLEAAEQAAKERLEAEHQAYLDGLRSQAEAELSAFFGEYNDELRACVLSRSEGAVNNNRSTAAFRFQWIIGSDDLQLAPTLIEWTDSYHDKHLTFAVYDTDTNSKAYNSATTREDLLLFMRQAYPHFKAQAAEREQRERREKIEKLAWAANWNYLRDEANIMAQHAQLVDLGEKELADTRLALYRAAVAEENRRQRQAAEREAVYAAAMVEYEAKMEAYSEACRQWAETEQARLWQPWTLWQVRYTAWNASYSEDEDPERFPVEEIYTLDTPEDIVRNMNPVARVEKVDYNGQVTEGFAIATFLDAKAITYATPPAIDDLSHWHHRRWAAGGYAVHVPPFVLEEPAPFPERPQRPEKE